MTKELNHTLFAEYVVKKWKQKIRDLNIHGSGELANSFIFEVKRNAGGDAEKMIFTFRYYGRFVDMGVGKGITLEDLGFGTRTPKRWFSSIIYSEVRKLAKLMAQDIAFEVNKTIVETLAD